MYLSRGQRIKLSELCESKKFTIKILVEDEKKYDYDISCFGLDEFDKCSDDNFFIFYNQKKSPCNSIILLNSNQNNLSNFEINLSTLPQKIKKLVFTITIDGNGIMSEIKQGSFLLLENGNIKGGFKFNASDFNKEKSIIVTQIYLKDEWRFSAVGIGFNGGLSSLLEHFGIQEEKNEEDNKRSNKGIDLNNNNNPNKISSFVKNILAIPQKYTDKKNNEREFQSLLKDFLSDGILTIQEMNKLEQFCKENNLNLQECLSKSQQDIEKFFSEMLTKISNNIVTKEEETKINQVCNFFNTSQNIRNEIKEKIIQAQIAKFQSLLKDFLSDGILTIQEMNKLQEFCTENNLNLQECLNKSQLDIERFLRRMLTDIVSDNIVTQEEEDTINSVCRFLNPSPSIKTEINETIKRVKTLQNIRSGNINTLTNHGLITPISELVWYCEKNIQLIRELKHETKLHNGEFFVTSERIIFKSKDYPTEILLKNIINIEVDGSYFYINGKNAKSTVKFKLINSEMLEAYLEQSLNKFYRKLNLNQTAGKTRTIPQNVKQEVWERDGGKCVECHATEYLEFDHQIPFSKGGSNSAQNIQLLCRKCNLSKSDKI